MTPNNSDMVSELRLSAVTWSDKENQPMGPPIVTVPMGASDGGAGRGFFMGSNVELTGAARLYRAASSDRRERG
ncbi:MAG TPA: hypothetical protein PLV19_09110 [Nitrosomonas sp.]|nr:hypothetical protein [Nitrosomonas sp.]